MTATSGLSSVLAPYWHPVARAADVGDRPVACELLGERVALFRVAGEIVAIHDLCVHRGTALSLGWVEGDRITCAYHGWQYATDGACVRIPSLAPGKPIPPKARARTFPSLEAYGLVWVALGDPPASFPAPDPFSWDEAGFRGFALGPYPWVASAGRVAENVLDFSHFPWVHENLLGVRSRSEISPHAVRTMTDGIEFVYEQLRPGSPHNNFRDERVRNDYRVVLPFIVHDRKTVVEDQSVTVLTFIASPTAPNCTSVFVVIARNYDLDGPDEPYAAFTERVLEQDRAIVESQRPEMLPLDLREELHLRIADGASMAYRRALGNLAGLSGPADGDGGYL